MRIAEMGNSKQELWRRLQAARWGLIRSILGETDSTVARSDATQYTCAVHTVWRTESEMLFSAQLNWRAVGSVHVKAN